MLARNETIFKWAQYAGVTAVLFLLQGALLQRLEFWGVIPFLYPMLAAVLGIYERPVAATVYALVLGVVCDLLLAGPIPCFYTLVFPLVGLGASLIAQSLLPAGFLCGLVATAAAFLLADLFHCFLLWASGQGAWQAGLWVMVREFCVTAPLLLVVIPLYAAVFRRTHLDD